MKRLAEHYRPNAAAADRIDPAQSVLASVEQAFHDLHAARNSEVGALDALASRLTAIKAVLGASKSEKNADSGAVGVPILNEAADGTKSLILETLVTQHAAEAPLDVNEEARLQALWASGLLDTPAEPAFDALTKIAATAAKAPVALVSLVDKDRQWFKSRHGLDLEETPRTSSFCAWTILTDDVLWVEDATLDPRFRNLPFVAGPGGSRFYAGAPIRSPSGYRIGSLCILAAEPRQRDPAVIALLRHLAELCSELCTHRAVVAEHQKELNAAGRVQTAFLSNMSHELRTPLNGIVGVAEVLSQSALDADQRELLGMLTRSATTLTTLVTDLVDAARLEASDLELEFTAFSISRVLAEAIAPHDAAASAKGLSFICDPLPTGRYFGDPLRLRQLVGHLASNAVKFTDKGSVRVSAAAAPIKGGDEITIVVEDTGVGFDSETAARMFKIFEIGDSSATRKFGGAGLGLALSRRLAEQMGAELRAQSTVGRGSRFTLTIALQHAPGDADDEDNCASVCTLEPLASMKVLVADDHPSNRRLVEVILSAAGFQVTSVENGFLALEAFRTQRFDLIMMDVQMPVMDGLTAIRNMRAYERTEGRHRSRICVLSANALPEHASASIAAGADRHIAKPVKPDELLQAAFEAEPPQSLAQFD